MSDVAIEQKEVSREKMPKQNYIMYPLGTLGRDFLYNFFNSYLLTFILLTKNLSVAQFSSITFIIVAARIFDALNDPIMGGIVENTRTKWGKYKPWQLIGAVLTGAVIIAMFNVNLYGWEFIGFLAFGYFLFSITFTINDISYWGMMPTLTSNPEERDKLMSITQVFCAIGGGLAGVLVPTLTTGEIGVKVFGNSIAGYKYLSIIVAIMMIAFQLFTIFGVKEKPLPANFAKIPRLKIKDMIKVIAKNDQLLWASLVMLLFNIGTNVVVGGLGMMYSYFEFGYDGMLWTVFGAGFAVVSVCFTVFYPWISKKMGRDKALYSAGFAIIVGYVLMMIFGLTLPNIVLFTVPFLNVTVTLKYLIMLICYTVAGWGQGFYLIGVINIANTVEYNEYKTGKREEGLIFSLRPLTAKMGSAIMQGLVSLVFVMAGVLTITNGISDFENQASQGIITPEAKLDGIRNLIANVPEKNKMILLVCLCLIPAIFAAVALIIHKKKFKLNESQMEFMLREIEARKKEEAENEGGAEGDCTVENVDTDFEITDVSVNDAFDYTTENCACDTLENDGSGESADGSTIDEIADNVKDAETVQNEKIDE